MVSGSLLAVLCGLSIHTNAELATPVVDYAKYMDGEGNYQFIDVNGQLSSVLEEPYAIEILVTGLGFGEGPKWIQDCDYPNDGYMLMADQFSNAIWKYYATDDMATNYTVETLFEIPFTINGATTKPNGIGWNLNYPDEIYVALQDSNAIARFTLEGELLNIWNATEDDIMLNRCNDVVSDSQGNAYFTTWPWDYTETVTTGAWMIDRETWTVSLIEATEYGTNGIAMTLDESVLVVANGMDFPPDVWDGGARDQVNYTNLYFRGYENSATGSMSNDFSADNAFYYLQGTTAPSAFTPYNLADGSAFDFDNNYWQSMIDGSTAEGYAVITNSLLYGNNDSAIIGMINFTDTGRGPTNFAKGMDGYMYVTLTQWNDGGWGTGGALARFKLKNSLTNENDGATSDYVLDCSSSDASGGDSGTSGETADDSGACGVRVMSALVALFAMVAMFA